MKTFFIAGSILFTVLMLILAFENIALQVNNFLFVLIPMGNPFLMVMSIAGVGVMAGVFYAGLVATLLKNKDEEEEELGAESIE